jgi:hypothetical protein
MKKHKNMQTKSIAQLLAILADPNATQAQKENAAYTIQWLVDTAVAMIKGTDRPLYTPPNP